jgi:hypothetical protein
MQVHAGGTVDNCKHTDETSATHTSEEKAMFNKYHDGASTKVNIGSVDAEDINAEQWKELTEEDVQIFLENEMLDVMGV